MPTIKDVAAQAKVSVSTVSLVLNNSSLVKVKTRERVLQVIKDLDYTPNQNARSLVTNNKKVIGVVWPSERASKQLFSFSVNVDTYLTEMLPSIEKEINGSSYSLLLEHYFFKDPSGDLPFLIRSKSVGGVLITGGIIEREVVDRIVATQVPLVLVGSRHEKLDYVDTDPELGLYKGTRFLIENGHRDILFINGPSASQSTERKKRGFLKAMQEAGLAVGRHHLRQSDYSGITAYNIMNDLWDDGARPTALIGATDGTAIGALRFLLEKGLACPRDISAIGFEDGLLAEFCLPPLTSIRVNKEKIGVEACRTLLNRMENPKAKQTALIIEPELVVRESVAALR